jgi:D-3-phosphoglycerate dehydrogenase
MKPLVLITDDVHELLPKGLAEIGFDVQYDTSLSYEAVKQVAASCTGIVINSRIVVDQAFLDAAPGLKFVARLGSGLDIIDLPAAKARGVEVISSPLGNANAVAEHALGMLLALANKLLKADAEVRQFVWKREANRGFELEGKTIGIIGFGHTGPAFARKLLGFDCKVLVYDKYVQDIDANRFPHVTLCGLADLLAQADIISIHLPLTEETRYFVDATFLEQAKPGVILINTSRGGVLHTKSLIEYILKGKLSGACLDVFENEKPNTYSPEEREMYTVLNSMEQVILSPHVAGWTHESKEKIAQITLGKIKEYMFKQ